MCQLRILLHWLVKFLFQSHLQEISIVQVSQAPLSERKEFHSNVLKHLKVNFNGVNVLEDENLRKGIKDFSDWPTIPQLYVKGEFVGGCDIVKEMFEKGELKTLLEEKKLI